MTCVHGSSATVRPSRGPAVVRRVICYAAPTGAGVHGPAHTALRVILAR
jgi:hypothetical protein